MNTRALWMLSALLVSPAWSQEPGFDLKSDALKSIVRDTAATQFAQVRPVDERKVERARIDLTTVRAPAEKPVGKINLPDPPAPKLDGPVSALVDVLLGLNGDGIEVHPDRWMSCQWRNAAASSCPAVSSDPTWSRGVNSAPVTPLAR